MALLGEEGSPTVVGTVKSPGPVESLRGWYRVDDPNLFLEVGPLARPEKVASLTAVETQLIDANTLGSSSRDTPRRGADATGIGGFQEHVDYDPQAKASSILSTGRLPTSKWIAWAENPSQEVIAALSSREAGSTRGKQL